MTSVLGWLKPRLQCTYEVPKKKLKLKLVMKGSKRQDNSKNNVAAVYFESSLTMHNPLFLCSQIRAVTKSRVLGIFPGY